MAIIIVEPSQKLAKKDFEIAREEYNSYVKITIDLKKEIVALGGKWHADAEKLLLELGSKQSNIWGGGFDFETKDFRTDAMVNLNPLRNNSTEILDGKIKERFIKLAKKVLQNYV